jgi:hypothetical protein
MPNGDMSASAVLPFVLATPTITSVTPTTRTIGVSVGFRLRVNGRNFPAGSVVRWNGEARVTTWVSSTQLDADIPSTDADTAGTARVTVVATAAGATAESAPATIQLLNPAPSFTGSFPYALRLGDQATLIALKGYGFLPGVTQATLNGRRTGFVASQIRIEATATAADMDSLGTVRVEITNAPPGGGTAIGYINVVNPIPRISSVTPATALRGSPAFTLIVKGSGFAEGAKLLWGGSERSTTRISRYELRAAIPATDLGRGGQIIVTVVNPAPGGGVSDNSAAFNVLERTIKIP